MDNETFNTCCVCGEEATMRCNYCENWYCDKHYNNVVMTGNCCRGNELDYKN